MLKLNHVTGFLKSVYQKCVRLSAMTSVAIEVLIWKSRVSKIIFHCDQR